MANFGRWARLGTQKNNKQTNKKKWVHAEEQETEEDVKKGKGGGEEKQKSKVRRGTLTGDCNLKCVSG